MRGRRWRGASSSPTSIRRVPIELEVGEPGTYWFDVECDGRLLSRILLVVEMA
jgi:hypothetical protein